MAESLVYTIINNKGKPSVLEVGGSSVGPRGIRGEDGRQGVDGAPGQAATVRVGTVTAGDWPDVTNSGTELDAVLDFVLPRGPKGNTGSVGPVGPEGRAATIQVGTVTSGTTPAVRNVGTNTDAIFNFTLAKGDQGEIGPTGQSGVYIGTEEPTDPVVDVWVNPNGTVTDFKGDKGDPGEAATIAVGTVTSGAIPSVINSGTSSDAVFDFVLVPGAKGDDGAAATIAVGNVTKGQTASVVNSGTSTNAVFDFVLPQGDDGLSASVNVGTTTTGQPGTNASVVNSGTTRDAILDFTIPRGADGLAATISVGTVSSGLTASVTNSGTSQNAVFDFVLPKGDAATIAVGSTTTGQPGTSASVVNSGTSANAVFDFTIPQGATGQAATIAVGTVTTGSAGSSASVTNSGTSSAAVFDFVIPKGDTGAGVPSGGSAGQVLVKTDGTDYNTAWITPQAKHSYAFFTGARTSLDGGYHYTVQSAYFGCSDVTDAMEIGELRTIKMQGAFSGNIINWTFGSGKYTVIPEMLMGFSYAGTWYSGSSWTSTSDHPLSIRTFQGGSAFMVSSGSLYTTGLNCASLSILRTE